MKLLEDDEEVPGPTPKSSILSCHFHPLIGGKGREGLNGGFLFFGLRRMRPCTQAPMSRPSRRRSTARWRAAPAPAPAPPPLPPPNRWITATVSPLPLYPRRLFPVPESNLGRPVFPPNNRVSEYRGSCFLIWMNNGTNKHNAECSSLFGIIGLKF